MDDVTRATLPDDQTAPRGASASEFTIVAHPAPRPPQPAVNQPAQRIGPPAQARVPYSPPPVASRPANARPPVRPRSNFALIGVVMALFAGTLVFSVSAFVVLRLANAARLDDGLTPTPAAVAVAPTSAATLVPTPTVGLDIQPWDGKRRFTMLLMGIDKRPGEKGTAFRTDSMIIFSIDPATRSIGILSVPRDLYVDIPTDTVVRSSYGLQRINSAYVIGELARPGYGPQLAMQTVQYNLGMRINDYVVFEFNTVISAVDAVGGIDINVPYNIYDPQYPNMYFGYDPLYIPAGPTHMDGKLALKYARTRHQTNDFDRAKRQQQVILAVRDKILNLNMAPGLIARAPELWKQFSETTHSDLTFEQLLQLAIYAKDVPKENIHQGVLDYSYVTPVNWQGASVLVPERARIGPLLAQVFGPNYN